MEQLVLAVLAFLTSGVGALGGLGGAVLLVPALVLVGMPPSEAAPLGLLSVAAGSVAAGARQLADRTVQHRIGVVTETAASTGAVAGALLSGAASETVLARVLGVSALAAALGGGLRRGLRNRPVPGLGDDAVGEAHGRLAGAYPTVAGVVPYRARRLPLGLALTAVSGVIAGLAGASGGFLKTPAISEVMHVPVKVAASTTTFTVGVTSSAALLVFAAQGRVDLDGAGAVVAGSLVGGRLGAAVQQHLSPVAVRRALSVVLAVVGAVLLTTA